MSISSLFSDNRKEFLKINCESFNCFDVSINNIAFTTMEVDSLNFPLGSINDISLNSFSRDSNDILWNIAGTAVAVINGFSILKIGSVCYIYIKDFQGVSGNTGDEYSSAGSGTVGVNFRPKNNIDIPIRMVTGGVSKISVVSIFSDGDIRIYNDVDKTTAIPNGVIFGLDDVFSSSYNIIP